MSNVIVHIPASGLFSNIGRMLTAFHVVYSRNKDEKLFFDTRETPYFKTRDVNYYFKVNSVNELNDAQKKECEVLDFRPFENSGPRRHDGMTFLSRAEIKQYIQYQDDFKSKIDDKIKSLSLPEDYICFHVRRGDKILEKPAWTSKRGYGEAIRHEVEEYFQKLREHFTPPPPPPRLIRDGIFLL